MKANVKMIRKVRRYSKEFKQMVVSEYESGKFTVYQLEKLYGVCNPSVYNWIYKYSTFNEKDYRIVEHKQSSTNKLKQLQKENEGLKAKVGEKQILIDYLEQLIKVASEELKTDIKKNFDTLQSSSSKETKNR